MPVRGEPSARLINVTVAEVAEALEAGYEQQYRRNAGDQLLDVYSVTVERRALFVLLVRNDDSFVWRVALARPMTGTEFRDWLGRGAYGTA
jgi:hypothetical protein